MLLMLTDTFRLNATCEVYIRQSGIGIRLIQHAMRTRAAVCAGSEHVLVAMGWGGVWRAG
jgi:hypothetical protein